MFNLVKLNCLIQTESSVRLEDGSPAKGGSFPQEGRLSKSHNFSPQQDQQSSLVSSLSEGTISHKGLIWCFLLSWLMLYAVPQNWYTQLSNAVIIPLLINHHSIHGQQLLEFGRLFFTIWV